MTDHKRNRTVDPDTGEDIQDTKRPRIQLDVEKKVACLLAAVSAYKEILGVFIPRFNIRAMETDEEIETVYDI